MPVKLKYYKKLIAASVPVLLIWLNTWFGIDLMGVEKEITTTILGIFVLVAVERTRNG